MKAKAIYLKFSCGTLVVMTSSKRMMFDVVGRHFTTV